MGAQEDAGQALSDAGLDRPGADESFDRFARLVRRHLGVSALVTIVLPDGQLYPGADGLPEPLQSTRRSHLEQPMCGEVVRTGGPLVFDDLTTVPGEPARSLIDELGMRSYAGYPVVDRNGTPVGTVCAVAPQPRPWSATDLDTLADLAEACSAEIRLRQERRRAEQIKQVAVEASRRTELLLDLTERLARAASLTDVSRTLNHVATGIGVSWSGLALLDPTGTALALTARDGSPLIESTVLPGLPDRLPLDAPYPASEVARTQTPAYVRDGAELLARWPALSRWFDEHTGGHAYLPLVADGALRGAAALAWDGPVEHDVETRRTCMAIAAGVAGALDRVQVLEHRHAVAATLQAAMLTELPETPHLTLTATYSTATRTDQVGGDWFDAVTLDPDRQVLMIGDVTGHDMQAAARMGQLRSMLRTLAWCQDESASGLLSMLDHVNHGLALRASATLLVARLDRQGADGGFAVQWSAAGHPPPLVRRGNGSVEHLAGRPDLLLGVEPGAGRTDHPGHLAVGDTLVLYTDGLVESRTVPYPERMEQLRSALGALSGCPTAELPQALVERLVPEPQRDDVAVLVAHVH